MFTKKQIKKIFSIPHNFKNSTKEELTLSNVGPLKYSDDINNKEDIYRWIAEGIDCFKEWYQPVDFGNGIIAHTTTPPNWEPRPELLNTNDRGIGKWEYIVKKHIPNIGGKRVLDLGCSSGMFSLEMARLGAKEVIGIDRNVFIKHRSSNTPPAQNVVAQANFVKKAFELLNKTTYPITYIPHDIGQLETLNLKPFDLILALHVVYHELDMMPRLVSQLASLTNYLVLQTSLGHSGKLAKWASIASHVDILLEVGFTAIEIDAPLDDLSPMIIAKK